MWRALVVEDDQDLRELLSEGLELEGYEVDATANGREAIVLAGQRPFDIIFLDLDLEELSGTAVLRVVRDLGYWPLVVLSGRSGDWQRELLDAGATACMPKPYVFRDLFDLSAQILRTGESTESGWPTEVQRLAPEDIDAVGRLSDEEIDRLPFGAICLDRAGRITRFNSYEQAASRYRPEEILGRRFEEVAPCTRVKEFAGRVDAGLQGQPLDEVLRFVFPRFGSQCVVSVRLFRDEPRDQLWIFVSKWRGAGRGTPGAPRIV